MPTSTHYTSALYAAASASDQSNGSATNPYLNLAENSTVRSSIRLYGGGGTTVQSGSGYITISSTSYISGSYITVYNGTISHNTSGVSAGTPTCSSGNLSAGGNLYIPVYTVDSYGHVTSKTYNTCYLPADNDYQVRQDNQTTSVTYPILLATAAGNTGAAGYTSKAYIQPSTGNIYSSGAVISYEGNSSSVVTSALATTSSNGICRFSSSFFTVNSGLVSLQLVNGSAVKSLNASGSPYDLLYIDSSNYISIGSTSTSPATLLKANALISFNFSGYNNKYTFSTSNMYADGVAISCLSLTQTSDIRLKNVSSFYHDVMKDIEEIRPFRFTWKDKRDYNIHGGVSAQAIRKFFPEFVSEDREGMLSVDYSSAALCLAITGLKELNSKIDSIDIRLKKLEDAA